MAMINCPECGKQVSDKAINCVNCGCPIAINKKVRIGFEKIIINNGHRMNFSGTVVDIKRNLKLFDGSLSEILFEIDEPTEIRVYVKGMQNKAQANLKKVVEPGKKYLIQRVAQKIFTPVYGIVEVDVIDAD